MGSKNAFAKRMQARHDSKVLNVGTTMSQWSSQICLDALVKTLGYGSCMKNDPWGEQRIVAFAREWLSNADEIWGGLTRQPDADAIRIETDKLLKKKIPSVYGPWKARYIGWQEVGLEKEVEKFRGLWKRQGLLEDDGGTSDLLKGVGKE